MVVDQVDKGALFSLDGPVRRIRGKIKWILVSYNIYCRDEGGWWGECGETNPHHPYVL